MLLHFKEIYGTIIQWDKLFEMDGALYYEKQGFFLQSLSVTE